MVRIYRWILCAPTDFAEIPGAYHRPCFPVNSLSARTTRQVGLLWWLLSSGMICVASGSWDPAFLSKSHRRTPASRRLQTTYQTRRCSCGQEFGDRLDALEIISTDRSLDWLNTCNVTRTASVGISGMGSLATGQISRRWSRVMHHVFKSRRRRP